MSQVLLFTSCIVLTLLWSNAVTVQDLRANLPANFSVPNVNLDVKHWEKQSGVDPEWVKGLKIGDGVDTDAKGEQKCSSFIKEMVVKTLPAFNDCMNQQGLTIGTLMKNHKLYLPCLVKCMGIKLNILNPDGLVNYDYAKGLIDQNIPPRFMKLVTQIWENCVSFVKKLEPNDKECKSYQPIIKCVMKSMFKVAKEAVELCPELSGLIKMSMKALLTSGKAKKEVAS